MRIAQTKVYSFNELSAEAKETAIENYRDTHYEMVWFDEYCESLKKGLEFYGFTLDDYSIDTEAYRSYARIGIDDDIGELSGIRLWKYLQNNFSTYHCNYTEKTRNTLDGNCPFTGYIGDEDFLDEIKNFIAKPYDTDFRSLIMECVENTFTAIEKDYEYQMSDECITERLTDDDYEYTADGQLF